MQKTLRRMVLLAACGLAGAILSLGATIAAAETLTFACDAPAKRTDGSPLPSTEIAGYTYRRGSVALGTSQGPACGFKWPIPAGECVRSTEALTATATDTEGRVSAASTPPATLAADACTPKAPPQPPGNVRVVSGAN